MGSQFSSLSNSDSEIESDILAHVQNLKLVRSAAAARSSLILNSPPPQLSWRQDPFSANFPSDLQYLILEFYYGSHQDLLRFQLICKDCRQLLLQFFTHHIKKLPWYLYIDPTAQYNDYNQCYGNMWTDNYSTYDIFNYKTHQVIRLLIGLMFPEILCSRRSIQCIVRALQLNPFEPELNPHLKTFYAKWTLPNWEENKGLVHYLKTHLKMLNVTYFYVKPQAQRRNSYSSNMGTKRRKSAFGSFSSITGGGNNMSGSMSGMTGGYLANYAFQNPFKEIMEHCVLLYSKKSDRRRRMMELTVNFQLLSLRKKRQNGGVGNSVSGGDACENENGDGDYRENGVNNSNSSRSDAIEKRMIRFSFACPMSFDQSGLVDHSVYNFVLNFDDDDDDSGGYSGGYGGYGDGGGGGDYSDYGNYSSSDYGSDYSRDYGHYYHYRRNSLRGRGGGGGSGGEKRRQLRMCMSHDPVERDASISSRESSETVHLPFTLPRRQPLSQHEDESFKLKFILYNSRKLVVNLLHLDSRTGRWYQCHVTPLPTRVKIRSLYHFDHLRILPVVGSDESLDRMINVKSVTYDFNLDLLSSLDTSNQILHQVNNTTTSNATMNT